MPGHESYHPAYRQVLSHRLPGPVVPPGIRCGDIPLDCCRTQLIVAVDLLNACTKAFRRNLAGNVQLIGTAPGVTAWTSLTHIHSQHWRSL